MLKEREYFRSLCERFAHKTLNWRMRADYFADIKQCHYDKLVKLSTGPLVMTQIKDSSTGRTLAHLGRATNSVTINAGYAWDGASNYPDYPGILRGSCVHDVLYQMLREGLFHPKARKVADKILYEYCREDGMSWVHAQAVYWAVRWFAGSAAKPS